MTRPHFRPFAALVILISGFIVWSLVFVALYAGHALGCAWYDVGQPSAGANVDRLLAGLWALGVALQVWLLLWIWRRAVAGNGTDTGVGPFIKTGAVALAAGAALATAWLGLPMLLLDACV